MISMTPPIPTIPGTAKFRRPLTLLLQASLVISGLATVASCVWRTEHKIETVSKIDAHIVIDIRQLREEASQVEDYVRGETTQPPKLGEGAKPTSRASSTTTGREQAARPWWTCLDPAGTAAAADEIRKDAKEAKPLPTAAEKSAIEARRARHDKIDEGLNKGILGENDRGYVELLVTEKQDAAQFKAFAPLAKDENRDRTTIRRATVERRKLGEEGLKAIEIIYAEKIRITLKEGQMFQSPRDKKEFQVFQQSELGRKYPEAKPGQWLKKI